MNNVLMADIPSGANSHSDESAKDGCWGGEGKKWEGGAFGDGISKLSEEGIGDEANTQDDGNVDDDNDDHDDEQPWQYGVNIEPTRNYKIMARMALWMLHCMRADSPIVSIKQTDEYWIATLLDPCRKPKYVNFLIIDKTVLLLTESMQISCHGFQMTDNGQKQVWSGYHSLLPA